ncbi:hypothetical protein WJX74_011092 [Apatococcus lobatus]|uniref:F-box domain-containing protein n=1 Tax=Apatococcus lobatus TaxID=904363 RepID=A0AAW1RBY2_9CHLO
MPPHAGSRLLELGPDLCTKIACWIGDDLGDVVEFDLVNLAATCQLLREVVLRDEVWASVRGEHIGATLLQRSNAFSDVARRQLRQLRTLDASDYGPYSLVDSASLGSIEYFKVNFARARHSRLQLRGHWDVLISRAFSGTDVVPIDGISM